MEGGLHIVFMSYSSCTLRHWTHDSAFGDAWSSGRSHAWWRRGHLRFTKQLQEKKVLKKDQAIGPARIASWGFGFVWPSVVMGLVAGSCRWFG